MTDSMRLYARVGASSSWVFVLPLFFSGSAAVGNSGAVERWLYSLIQGGGRCWEVVAWCEGRVKKVASTFVQSFWTKVEATFFTRRTAGCGLSWQNNLTRGLAWKITRGLGQEILSEQWVIWWTTTADYLEYYFAKKEREKKIVLILFFVRVLQDISKNTDKQISRHYSEQSKSRQRTER